jgi:hypothetical protein
MQSAQDQKSFSAAASRCGIETIALYKLKNIKSKSRPKAALSDSYE